MGGSRWSDSDYQSYSRSTNYRTASRAEVFQSRKLVEELNPALVEIKHGPYAGMKVRESADSEENPNSTPIILALDVTGSMGAYAELIAKNSLPELMTDIHELKPVSDPHLMFMGVDDVHSSRGGDLQVSQFEADLRILEQLRKIWLVGGGGGNNSESYDLPWYFAAKKTKIDSFDKRGKKGYLFTMGDEEAPYQTLSTQDLEQVFGPGEYQALKPKEALELAKQRYNVFHIVIEQGSHCQVGYGRDRVYKTWTELMGTNVLFLKDFKNLSDLVISTMKIVEGADVESVIAESKNPASLRHAYQNSLE